MKFIQRLGYYLGGFSIGLVILAFFLNGKKVSCSYGPESRVLKNINTKEIIYSSAVKSLIHNKTIDSLTISHILKKGDLNFSNSTPRQLPCGIYSIEGFNEKNNIYLTVENCDNTATVLNAVLKTLDN